jgi:hypothetical protein
MKTIGSFCQGFAISPRVGPVNESYEIWSQERGIVLKVYSEGEHSHLHCPSCQGGNNNDKDLAVTIQPGGREAFWKCFRANCGFSGKVAVGSGNRAPLHPAGDDAAPSPPVQLFELDVAHNCVFEYDSLRNRATLVILMFIMIMVGKCAKGSSFVQQRFPT